MKKNKEKRTRNELLKILDQGEKDAREGRVSSPDEVSQEVESALYEETKRKGMKEENL